MNKVSMGFKETKEVLAFAMALGKAIELAKEDGKITLSDAPNFLPALLALFPAIDEAEAIPMEFKVSTPEEIAELKQYVKDNLDLKDDELELFIEDAFKVALDILLLVKVYFMKPELGKANDADTVPGVEE